MAETKTGLEGIVKYRMIAGTASVGAGSTLSYVTGADYSWDTNKKDVFNRATFAHYKKGRGLGKFDAKMLYVDYTDVTNFRAAVTGITSPQCYVELQIDGINGTGEKVISMPNCGVDSFKFSQPEDDLDNLDVSFTMATEPVEVTYANRLIT